METQDKILFYSHYGEYAYLSNFYPAKFIENNVEYSCSEQYLMKKKQELFDPTNIILANKILQNTNPAEIKKFGRQVRNFTEQTWDLNKLNIMVQALRLKFTQNIILKNKLKNTGNKNLYEASPYDRIWGTGFNAQETLNKINSNQNGQLGQNLLGTALEIVRLEL